ncbi:PHD finger protein ING1-like protein [Drosera capensis]
MSFIDEFQSNIELLPNILQKKYALLRDLDSSLQEIVRQNEQRCEQEIEDIKQGVKSGNIMPDLSRIRFSDEAVDEQKHCIRIADEKVALAVQAYDLVDAHIQQLDQFLRISEEELRHETEAAAANALPDQNADANAKPGRVGESGRPGRKKSKPTTIATPASANPTSMDLDLPVDPNEPTYCVCNQVSFGEMVACDNPDNFSSAGFVGPMMDDDEASCGRDRKTVTRS